MLFDQDLKFFAIEFIVLFKFSICWDIRVHKLLNHCNFKLMVALVATKVIEDFDEKCELRVLLFTENEWSKEFEKFMTTTTLTYLM